MTRASTLPHRLSPFPRLLFLAAVLAALLAVFLVAGDATPVGAQAIKIDPPDLVLIPHDRSVEVGGFWRTGTTRRVMQYRESGTTAVTTVTLPTDNFIRNLTNGTKYDFRSKSETTLTGYANSDWSDWYLDIQPNTPPGAPTLTVTAGDAKLTVNITPPTSWGANPAAGYKIGYRPSLPRQFGDPSATISYLRHEAGIEGRELLPSAATSWTLEGTHIVRNIDEVILNGVEYTVTFTPLNRRADAPNPDPGTYPIRSTDPAFAPHWYVWGTPVTVKGTPNGRVRLASNLSKPRDTGTGGDAATGSSVVAQGFTTGEQTGGFALGGIEVSVNGNPTEAQRNTIRAELWSESDDAPSAKVADLTVPAHPITAGLVEFQAPGATTLSESTTYFLVVYTTGSYSLSLQTTEFWRDDRSFPTGDAVFTILDDYRSKSGNDPAASDAWGTTTGHSLRIRVNKPPPSDSRANLLNLTASWSSSATGNYAPLDFRVSTGAGAGAYFRSIYSDYAATVVNDISHLKLSPTAEHAGATVEVGKTGSLTTVASGSESAAIALVEGANAITVKVTARDGTTTKTYTLNVTRLAAGATVNMGFRQHTLLAVEGESDTSFVQLSAALAADTTATITRNRGTATDPADYTLSTKTLSFPAGWTRAYFEFRPVADMTTEGEENVYLRLSPPANAPYALPDSLDIPSEVQISFLDRSRTPGLILTANEFVITEGGSRDIVISLGTAVTETTTPTLTVLGSSTATESTTGTPADFSIGTIPDIETGRYNAEVTVTARDDTVDEPVEYIVLQAQAGGFTSDPEVIYLLDNDGAPIAPRNVRATPGITYINLEWVSVPGATGYEVQYKTAAASSWSTDSDTGSTNSREITGLQSDTTYDARVRAVNSSGNSPWAYPVVWEGALTPAAITASSVGCSGSAGNSCSPAGKLADNKFTFAAQEYEIAGIAGAASGIELQYAQSVTTEVKALNLRFAPLVSSAAHNVFRGAAGTVGTPDTKLSWSASANPLTAGTVALVQLSDPAQTTTKRAVSDNANLASLTGTTSANRGTSFGGALVFDQEFSASTTGYTSSVPNTVTHVKLTPTVADTGKATVKVGKAGSLADVASGSASAAIALADGANAITVRVRAENGATKDYTVTVTRRAAAAGDAIWEATLTPASIFSGAGVGCFGKAGCDAALTDNEFTVGGETFNFSNLQFFPGGNQFQVYVAFGQTVSAALSGYKFCVGTTDFNIGMPGLRDVVNTVHDLGWTVGTPVDVSIRRVCHPLSLSGLGFDERNHLNEGGTYTIVGKLNHGPVTARTSYLGVALGLGVLDVRVDMPEPPSGQIQTFIQPGQDTFKLLVHVIDDDLPEQDGEAVTILVKVDLDRDGVFELEQTTDIRIANGDGGGIAIDAAHDALAEGDRETVTIRAADPSLIRPLKCLEQWNTGPKECVIPEGYGWWVEVTAGHDNLIGTPNATLSSTWPPQDGDYYAYNGRGFLVGSGELYFFFTPEDHTHKLTLVINEDAVDDEGESFRITARHINNPGYTAFKDFTIRNRPTEAALALDPSAADEDAGSVTLTATLNARAPEDIALDLSSDGNADDLTLPASLTIAAGERSGTATVTIIDDELDEDDEQVAIRAQGGTEWPDLSATATLTIRDNDDATQSDAVVVNPPTSVALSLDRDRVNEDAGTVTLTATLDAPAPPGGVTLDLRPGFDSTADADADYTMPQSIAIAAGERSGAASVTITDDAVDEEDETVNVVALAFSLSHDDLIGEAVLTIVDDDTAGVTVTAANPLGVAEGGSAAYTVVLDSRPTADVTIAATSGDGGRVSVSPASHTFTPSAWNAPVTFTVSGLADADSDDESVAVTNSVTSQDAKYANFVVSTVQVTVTDTPQQPPANNPPTVSSAIADATIVHESGTLEVSLTGVFNDADSDSLTITAGSSSNAVATASVSSDYATLTISARSRGTATITVNADDGNGGTVSDSFTVTVKAAPTVASAIGDVSGLAVGDSHDVSLSGVFRDADGDALTITATSTDLDAVNALVWFSTLTIIAGAAGTETVTVTAQDADGNRVSDSFDVSVVAAQQQEPDPPANNPPTVSSAIADVTIVHEGGTQSVSLSGVFNDADSDSLTITAGSSSNAVATASVSSGYATLTISAHSRGTAIITVTANDGNGGTVADTFTVRVKAAPTVASPISDVNGLETGATREISLSSVFSDADGDGLTVTAGSSNDAVATATVAADRSKLTLAGVSEGSATITVTARDADGNAVSDAFSVSVVPAPQPNNPPTVASAIADATIVHEGGTLEVSLSGVFSDADSDSLTVTAVSSNNAVATEAVSSDGATLTVNAQARGTATITVTANDGNGGTVDDAFTVTVKAAPTVASPIGDVAGLEAGTSREVSLSGVFHDADGDSLTVTAGSDNEGVATVAVAADQSALTVEGVAEGTATITVTAQDADGNTVSDALEVSVEPEEEQEQATSDGAPTVVSPIADFGLEGPERREIDLNQVFRDPDGQELTFSLASSHYHVATGWVDGSTLTVVGTGTGTATITVTAEDPDGNTVSDSFQVSVRPKGG